MDPAVLIFTIPILGILLGFFGVWTSHKQKLAKYELEARKGNGNAGQTERFEVLEDRIAVLERIVTDRGYDVATQIEALRENVAIEKRQSAEIDRRR
jgi:hypothetical protein